MTGSKEMFDYIKDAVEIYGKENIKIIAYGIRYDNGSRTVRLHIVDDTNGDIVGSTELQVSKLESDIKRLRDYTYLEGGRDINAIRRQLEARMSNMPEIRCYKNIGFQWDMDGNVSTYYGARCFDKEGKEIRKDVFAALPKCSGSVKNVVGELNKYMCKNIKRQIVLLHALSGAVCGLVKRNIILSLVGESSKGKTTAMKMGVSFFGEADYEKTALKWSATQNALVKRLDSLNGVNVLIDDTQLSRLKTFQNIIYSFEGGESFDRLEKGNKLGEKCHWYVSMGITAERSLVDTCSDKGAIGRLIEMTIQDKDLFDDTKEVEAVKKLYTANYGVVGMEFIQHLLENHTREDVQEKVEEEGKEAIEAFKKEINGDTVLARHMEGDIAVMTVTAKLANAYLGFCFQTSEIQAELLGLCSENMRTFEQNEAGVQDIKTIYIDIRESARKEYRQYEKDNKIIVPSSLMKDCLNKYVNKLKVKAAWIKGQLAAYGYLVERNGTYCWSHTIDSVSLSGYELNIKED